MYVIVPLINNNAIASQLRYIAQNVENNPEVEKWHLFVDKYPDYLLPNYAENSLIHDITRDELEIITNQQGRNVEVIEMPYHAGFNQLIAHGIANSSSDAIGILAADVVTSPGDLETLFATLEDHEAAGPLFDESVFKNQNWKREYGIYPVRLLDPNCIVVRREAVREYPDIAGDFGKQYGALEAQLLDKDTVVNPYVSVDHEKPPVMGYAMQATNSWIYPAQALIGTAKHNGIKGLWHFWGQRDLSQLPTALRQLFS